jgi:hypothetical protein
VSAPCEHRVRSEVRSSQDRRVVEALSPPFAVHPVPGEVFVPRRPLELHIEKLVLHGTPPAGRGRIAAAVERHLGRLLAEGGVPPGLAGAGRVLHLPGGSFEVPAGASAEAIGAEVARALHRAWGGEGGEHGAGRRGGGR